MNSEQLVHEKPPIESGEGVVEGETGIGVAEEEEGKDDKGKAENHCRRAKRTSELIVMLSSSCL